MRPHNLPEATQQMVELGLKPSFSSLCPSHTHLQHRDTYQERVLMIISVSPEDTPDQAKDKILIKPLSKYKEPTPWDRYGPNWEVPKLHGLLWSISYSKKQGKRDGTTSPPKLGGQQSKGSYSLNLGYVMFICSVSPSAAAAFPADDIARTRGDTQARGPMDGRCTKPMTYTWFFRQV